MKKMLMIFLVLVMCGEQKRYIDNQEYGFIHKIPKGWREWKIPEGSPIVSYIGKPPSSEFQVAVGTLMVMTPEEKRMYEDIEGRKVNVLPPDASDEEKYRYIESKLRSSVSKDGKILSIKRIRFQGYPAVSMFWEETRGKYTKYFKEIGVIRGARFYVILGSYFKAKNTEERKAEIEELINSFKFK